MLLAPPVAGMGGARTTSAAGLGRRLPEAQRPQVLELPLPSRGWDGATALLEAGDLDGAAVEMCRAYGLRRAGAGPILDWWRARDRADGCLGVR